MCLFDTSQMLFTLDLILKKQQQHQAGRGGPQGTVLGSVGLHVSSSGDGAGCEALVYRQSTGQICLGFLNSEKLCKLALVEHLTLVTLCSKVLWGGIPAPCYTHECKAIYVRREHSESRGQRTGTARRLTVTAGTHWGLSCSLLIFLFKNCLSCSMCRARGAARTASSPVPGLASLHPRIPWLHLPLLFPKLRPLLTSIMQGREAP